MDLLDLLKLAGIAIALTLSVVAAVRKLTDDNGHLTQWGKLNLLGILLGGFLSITAQMMEYSEKQEAQNRSIRDIERLLHPRGPIRLAYQIEISGDSKGAREVLREVAARAIELERESCSTGQFCFSHPGEVVQYAMPNKNRSPEHITLDKSSTIYGHAMRLSPELGARELQIGFYKKGRIDTAKVTNAAWQFGAPAPDLRLFTNAAKTDVDNPELSIELPSKTIHQQSLGVDTLIWSQSGTLASVLDFEGATILVTQVNLSPSIVAFKCLTVELERGRRLHIPGRLLKKLPGRVPGAIPTDDAYLFVFPEDLTKLDAECP